MVHKEVATYPAGFGNLEVDVAANKWYFRENVKRDKWSTKIVFSKREDKSELFLADAEECVKEFKEKFDLICVIPKSDPGSYSPTLLSIGKTLGEKLGIPFENIILRMQRPLKKMTDCKSARERYDSHKGTFALSRSLKPNEKTILLLDDIKAEGYTKLFCAELLIKDGAKTVKTFCLGINTDDASKSNEG